MAASTAASAVVTESRTSTGTSTPPWVLARKSAGRMSVKQLHVRWRSLVRVRQNGARDDVEEMIGPRYEGGLVDRPIQRRHQGGKIAGAPIETLSVAPQDIRHLVIHALISLVLREQFEFGSMQTDPNFANYRYQADTGRLVLLDFGAVRPVSSETSQAYRTLLSAGLAGNRYRMRDAAVRTGFLGEDAVYRHRRLVDHMIDVVLGEFNRPGPFDFGDRTFVGTIREDGAAMAADRETWHVPPVDTLFAQRKISGTALLVARLKARVKVRALIEAHCSPGKPGPNAAERLVARP